MAAKPINGSSWRKVPLLCVAAIPVKGGIWQMETGTAAEHDTWAHPDWGIRNKLLAQVTMHHDLNCPQAFVQLGHRTHQAEQPSLQITVVHQLSGIQLVTLNTRCHGFIRADTQGRNEVSWSPCHLVIWYHLFFSHQVILTKEMNVGRNRPAWAVFPGDRISMNFA
jgi:hypothetical protein